MTTFSQRVQAFNRSLQQQAPELPGETSWLNPFLSEETLSYADQFYDTFYNDHAKRVYIFGINPGRLGGGLTGVPLTDPVQLQAVCGIPNTLPQKQELSSQFVYEVIKAYGGARKFYSHFFITAVCPLGFVREGKNYNYYDDKELQQATEGFILETLQQQLQLGADTRVGLCMGEGKNYKYLQRLNAAHNFFETIIPLAHPRFILQYRRKQKAAYIQQYLEALQQALR